MRLTLLQQRLLAALGAKPHTGPELVEALGQLGHEVLLPWVVTALRRMEAGEVVRRVDGAWECTILADSVQRRPT